MPGNELEGSYRKFFDSRFIAADDVPVDKDVVLTITNVTLEKSKTNNDKLMSLHFKETDKMMVVNKTNAISIRKFTGTADVKKWKEHKITVFQSTCKAFGDPNVPCVRIREK